MARLTPGKTSASGHTYIPPTTRSETTRQTNTTTPECDAASPDPADTPSRRSARIATQPAPPPPPPSLTVPTSSMTTVTTSRNPHGNKKPRLMGRSPASKVTPRKPGGRVQVPVTPKRKRERETALSSPEKPTPSSSSRSAAGLKRGKGTGRAGQGRGQLVVGRDGPAIRPLPAPVNPPVKVEEVEEDAWMEDRKVMGGVREGGKIPHPFVRRSLFFSDPRYTFFD